MKEADITENVHKEFWYFFKKIFFLNITKIVVTDNFELKLCPFELDASAYHLSRGGPMIVIAAI